MVIRGRRGLRRRCPFSSPLLSHLLYRFLNLAVALHFHFTSLTSFVTVVPSSSSRTVPSDFSVTTISFMTVSPWVSVLPRERLPLRFRMYLPAQSFHRLRPRPVPPLYPRRQPPLYVLHRLRSGGLLSCTIASAVYYNTVGTAAPYKGITLYGDFV